jgi:hypothetical protein
VRKAYHLINYKNEQKLRIGKKIEDRCKNKGKSNEIIPKYQRKNDDLVITYKHIMLDNSNFFLTIKNTKQ